MHVNDCVEIWNKCKSLLHDTIDEESFKTWFLPIIPSKFENGRLIIEVPSQFFYEWISEHYSKLINEALLKICGFNVELEYSVKGNVDVANNYSNKSVRTSFLEQCGSFIKDNFGDVNNISRLNPNYTFENFIEGECNQLACSFAKSVALKPLNNPNNPLIIYSDVGLGKTHLLHAIGNKISENFRDKIVVYIETTKFMYQLTNSISKNNQIDFFRFYSNVDVLLLDDVQFLKDRVGTQQRLFDIFNQLYLMGKQIVLTSDRSPSRLEGLEDRLASRFKCGLTVSMNAPNFETKLAILKRKFPESTRMSDSILEYIAQRVNSNIRELEGVMLTAIAYVSMKHNIDMASIQKIINKILANDVEVDRISNAIADYFKISIEDIVGKSRKKDIALARQISMYFARKCTKCSLKEIGSLIGGRDHSTVNHAICTIEMLIATDKAMKMKIASINKEISKKMKIAPINKEICKK